MVTTDTLTRLRRTDSDLTRLPHGPPESAWETPSPHYGYRDPQWEITPGHSWAWFMHRFEGTLHSIQIAARFDPNDTREEGLCELYVLALDLHAYHGLLLRYLRGRGPCPPPIHEYLRLSREEWGEIVEWIREGERDA